MNGKPKSSAPDGGQVEPSDADTDDLTSDDYLDDKLAKKVNKLEKLIASQADTITKLTYGDTRREKSASRQVATDGWVD